jgi:hypothetical protein
MTSLDDSPKSAAVALGFWSAMACTALSLAYVLAQLAEWAGWLGSQGGPSSRSTLIWIASLWAITFPGATWALASWFRRARNAQCPMPNA